MSGGYCQRRDVLVGVRGLHVMGVERNDVGVRVEGEPAAPAVMGCLSYGVTAHAHVRQWVDLTDAPSFGVPVRLWWWKRRRVCPEPM